MPPLPAPRAAPGLAIFLVVALLAATGVVIGIMNHLKGMRLARERAEKQRLADELKAAAEAMKHAPAPPIPGPALPPVVSHPDIAPAAGPCPLGSNLVDGKTPYCIDVYEYPGGKTIPRTSISFSEAERLCKLRGERLCTDMEWERACRGKGGASYPYGAAFDPERCNTRGGEIRSAGQFRECRSASGAYDMSGNVAEWVNYHGMPAQKGGSAESGNSRCSVTAHGLGTEGGVFIGFRCCADPSQTR
jgi:hypothetical protein